MSAFAALQQRSLTVRTMDMSPSMDIVAVVLNDGTLMVMRTLSWEKIFVKTANELSESGFKPSILKFCHSGKLLGIALESEIGVIDIESSEYRQASPRVLHHNTGESNCGSILSLAWYHSFQEDETIMHQIQQPNLLEEKGKYGLDSSMLIASGGIHLVERFGMCELQEAGSSNDKDDVHHLDSIFAASAFDLMLSLAQNGMLQGHIFGIYPFFTVDLHSLLSSALPIKNPLKAVDGITINSASSSKDLAAFNCQVNLSKESGSLFTLSSRELSAGRLKYHQHACRLSLLISGDLDKLLDLVVASGRKWKEATRVIIPKIGLLQTALDGYQLEFSPIEFMYTIVQCGLWHPVVQSSFSSHWNDQGLARLKSAIETSSIWIIKMLQMRAIPLASNTYLRCIELLNTMKMLYPEGCVGVRALIKEIHYLTVCTEKILCKIDETLHEARKARESMLLFIQFIKEHSIAPDSPQAQTFKPDLSLRERFVNLFDPRLVRAVQKGPLAQAESVTATHLYMYLQDQDFPVALVNHRAQSKGRRAQSVDNPPQTNDAVIDSMHKIFETVDVWTCFRHHVVLEEVHQKPPLVADSRIVTLRETHSSTSLSKQIKIARDAYLNVFDLMHDETSTCMMSTTNHSDNVSTSRTQSTSNHTDSGYQSLLFHVEDDTVSGKTSACRIIVSQDSCFVSDVIITSTVTDPSSKTLSQPFEVQLTNVSFFLAVVSNDSRVQTKSMEIVVICCSHIPSTSTSTLSRSSAIWAARIPFQDDEASIEQAMFYIGKMDSVTGASPVAIVGSRGCGLSSSSTSSGRSGRDIFRVDINEDIAFQEITERTDAATVSTNQMISISLSEIIKLLPKTYVAVKKRDIVLQEITLMKMCGSRGTAGFADSAGRFLVFDMEADENEDEEDEDQDDTLERSGDGDDE